MLKTITVVHFSPTGGTRNAALSLVHELAESVQEIDLCLPNVHDHHFQSSDIVLFAVPVFGGRLPAYSTEHLKACFGNSAKAITAVVYGNRHYDDALLELSDCVTAQGFAVVASAALLAEHSMYRTLAAGRPDAQDKKQLLEFAARILKKLESDEKTPVAVPGNHPYREWQRLPVIPAASNACNQCGLCAQKCPTAAIAKEKPDTTAPDLCILCMRCIAICPQQARALPAPVQEMMQQKLSPLLSVRRANELFL